jgi:hypothetical protein
MYIRYLSLKKIHFLNKHHSKMEGATNDRPDFWIRIFPVVFFWIRIFSEKVVATILKKDLVTIGPHRSIDWRPPDRLSIGA